MIPATSEFGSVLTGSVFALLPHGRFPRNCCTRQIFVGSVLIKITLMDVRNPEVRGYELITTQMTTCDLPPIFARE